MELGMNMNFGSLITPPSHIMPIADGLSAYEYTQQLANSILINNGVPLNQRCQELCLVNGYDNTQHLAFKNLDVNTEKVDCSGIHQFLETIPIYNEVLKFHAEDRMNSRQSANTTSCYSGNIADNLGRQLIEKMDKNRSSDFFANESSALDMASQEQYLKNKSLGLNVHSDNSSTFSAEYMDKIQKKPSVVGVSVEGEVISTPKTNSLELSGAYTADSHVKAYQPIIVPQGTQISIPDGYIKVDAEKCSNRKTKVVTNCEHTDRKHYAKGLCSTCYHKGGRTKLAWNCGHRDRLHYAKGCCQDCYLQFHSKRGKKMNRKKALKDKQLKDVQIRLEMGSEQLLAQEAL